MAAVDLLQLILKDEVPQSFRLLVARGSAPLPPKSMLEALVRLVSDRDEEVSSAALKTISGWDEQDIIAQLNSPECPASILKYFADESASAAVLHSVIRNSATPHEVIESLAATVESHLLESILDNRARLVNSPEILKKIKANPFATPEIGRIVLEIETEFFGTKKTDYTVQQAPEDAGNDGFIPELEIEAPPDDLYLEGLPIDPDERQTAITARITSMSFREKIKYALFGNREIRALLVRDSNKEISRMVLRSPKLTENEVEGIAAMRGVTEEILREIGSSKKWTRSYNVAQNLVKNPKTPPMISQNLLFRLRTPDLTLLSRDRSVPEAVRHNAARTLNQRNAKRSS
jgi:hypothetical protein